MITSKLPSSALMLPGVKVTPMTLDEMMDLVAHNVDENKKSVIASLNLHALRILFHDANMRYLHQMDDTYVHIDGMPIVLLCRLAGVHATAHHRLTCLDIVWPLLRMARVNSWRVYYVGSSGTVLERALCAINAKEPCLQIRGHNGFFDRRSESDDNKCLLADIRRFKPHIVLVGMGMGTQEQWIRENLDQLPCSTILTVGALFEYLAGVVGTPPRWMGRCGIEWLYRLINSPRRFWRRYLLEPFVLLRLLTVALVRGHGR